jgi:phosphinothricin acetyltransferase
MSSRLVAASHAESSPRLGRSKAPFRANIKMADSDILIRPARDRDADRIAAIYAHHVAHGTASFDTSPRTSEATADKIAQCEQQAWPFIVAERDGMVIGYAYATQFRDRPAYASTCENSIYIDPAAIGVGLGTLLLQALIDASVQAGFRQMIAVVGGAEPASIALHQKMGFREAGRMRSVGRKHGRWLDTVYLQVALGEGDTTPPNVP